MSVRTNFFRCAYAYITLIFFLLTYQFYSYDYFDIDLIAYILSYFIIGIITLVEVIKKNKLLNLLVVFNVFGMLYTNYYISQKIFSNSIVNIADINSMNMSYLAIISFNAIYFLSNKIDIFAINKYQSIVVWERFRLGLIMLFIASLCAEYYVIFERVGLINYLVASRGGKSILLEGYGMWTFYKSTLPLVSTFSLYMYLRYKKNFDLLLCIMSVSFALLNACVDVSRAEIISILLPLVYLLSYFNVLNNRQVVFCFLGIGVLFGVWKSLFGNDIVFSFDSELNSWYKISVNILSDKTLDYLHGKTYFYTFINLFIPVTGIESLSTWYVRTYEYSVYILGGGRGFPGVVEAYMNFGYIGIFLVYGFYGFLFKQMREDGFLSVILYSIILLSVYQFFRSEAYSLWKNMMWMRVYPTMIIYFISVRYVCYKE